MHISSSFNQLIVRYDIILQIALNAQSVCAKRFERTSIRKLFQYQCEDWNSSVWSYEEEPDQREVTRKRGICR